MKRTNVLRTSGLAVAALTLSAGLAACGSDDEPTAEAATDSSETMEETPEETPMDEESEMGGEMDPAANLYGPACGEVPTSGDGSVEGMATAPVASAASANPLLATLVAAVTAADLVEPLNSAPELTVFAPANTAFEAFTKKQLNGLLADKETLTQVLTHHVVPQAIAPDQLEGEFETLNGDMLTINGAGEEATIGDEKAMVLCGGVMTANATVYIIDTVMMP
ncbi:MAG: fasciclin domain-containing protein [Nocardioides sp.]